MNFRADLGETCAQHQPCSPLSPAPGSALQEAEPWGCSHTPQVGHRLVSGLALATTYDPQTSAAHTYHRASVVWAGWFTAQQHLLGLSVMADSLQPPGPEPTRLLCPWDFSGMNTGVGCCDLLQGIVLTRGSNTNPRVISSIFEKRLVLFLPEDSFWTKLVIS